MWWLLALAAYAQPLRQCTDAGALVAEVADDGAITGRLAGRFDVKGTREAFTVLGDDGKPRWTGPLSTLHPRDPRELTAGDDTAARILEIFEVIQNPLACPLGGPTTLFVGKWGTPVAVPRESWVVAATDQDVLLRTADGVAWIRDVAMSQALAADVAAELREWLPDHTSTVATRDGRALLVVTKGIAIDVGPGVTPAPIADLDVLPLLRPPRALVIDFHPEKIVPAAAGANLELLVEVNALRIAIGLPAYERDNWLDWTALAHCAYLEWAARAGRPLGHEQDADSPAFFGDTPAVRSGGSEVVAVDSRIQPWESVSSWIATPFHRSSLLDPRTGRVGACATVGGPRVMEVVFEGDPAGWFAFPTSGMTDVPLSFDGLELPDPVPFPDRAAPMGFPLTVWLQAPTADFASAEGWLKDDTGALVPTWFVTPANHEHLANAPKAEVHLIPKRPLDPSRTYSWGVRWGLKTPPARKKDPPGVLWTEWTGTFTTARAFGRPAPAPTGVADLLAKGLDSKRTSLGASALAPDHDATVAAALVLGGGAESLVGVMQADRVAYACWTDTQAVTVVNDGTWPESLLDPALTRMGVRAEKKRTCLVAATPMLRPPFWDPRP